VNRLLVAGVLFLLISSSVIPISGVDTEQSSISIYNGKTLYVGGSGEGNYTNIQDAIDNASEGDTVFIFNGKYYENLTIEYKSNFSLIGENKKTTILKGRIEVNKSERIKIERISQFCKQFGEIQKLLAINLNSARKIFVINVNQYVKSFGKKLRGINLQNSSFCEIKDNSIVSNGVNIFIDSSSNNNTIYHNNFLSCKETAFDEGNNKWDNDYPSGGNYWDDYTGNDSNGDGIGDTPYPISGGENEDRYPLMEPYGSKPKKVVGTTGPLCPLLNTAEIEIIDGNSSQIKKIERILNNRILQFVIPYMEISVTDLDFSVCYNRENPSCYFLYKRLLHITVVTENGSNTFYNDTHTVTVNGLDGVFFFMRWTIRRLTPARFIFYGTYDDVTIEYPKGE
jgi:parallel beta-helix repeat protein